MHRLVLSFILSIAAGPAWAAAEFIQSPAYKECTALAESNPQAALSKAEEWVKVDTGGIAANHCRAMALYGLRRFEESGAALSQVRALIPPEEVILRTYVTRQGSRAYVSAGKTEAALGILGAQIADMATPAGDNATEAKSTAELLLDRARLRLTYGQLTEAVQDLDHAVSLNPMNEDVLFERARAFEQLNDIALAKQDLQALLRANPNHKDALAAMRRLRDAQATGSAR